MANEKIEIRVSGRTGRVDGYVEIILGLLNFAGVLRKHELSKKVSNGQTEIYIDAVLAPSPLGHVGKSDIKERE